ncbi:MAG: hypothetical protein ABIN67_18595 [Ferruginibacter sp.]
MYKFSLKDNGPGLDFTITRALLALAGFTAFVVRSDHPYYLNVIAGILLVLLAAFIKLILLRYKISRIILLTASAFLLFAATSSISFGAILLIYGLLFKFIYKKASIEVGTAGIAISKTFSTIEHPWTMFNNVILKDSLLTLDFKNNKLLQLNTDDTVAAVDEKAFNQFCNQLINPAIEVRL